MGNDNKKLRGKGIIKKRIAKRGELRVPQSSQIDSEGAAKLETKPLDYPSNKTGACISQHFLFKAPKRQQIEVTWKVSPEKVKAVSLYFDESYCSFEKILRVYGIRCEAISGMNTHYFHEITLHADQESCLVFGLKAKQLYYFEMGFKLRSNKFFPLLRSDAVSVNEEGLINLEKLQPVPPSITDWNHCVSTYSYYENKMNGWK